MFSQIDTFNYFDYVDTYQSDSTYIVNKFDKRIERVWLPRLVSLGGNKNEANKAITEYARAYTSSSLNSSNPTYKYSSTIESTGCNEYIDIEWEELGPFGDNVISKFGQIHNFDFSPNFTTDNTMYACDFHSGLYKSENRGMSWELITKSRKLPFAGVGDVEIHEDNNTLFVSTGSNEYGVQNYGTSGGAMSVETKGIFKSTDGGNNWQEIMDNNFWQEFERGGLILQMYLDPSSVGKNKMFIATNKGVWECPNVSAVNPIWSKNIVLNQTNVVSNYSNFYRDIVTDYSSNNHLYFSSDRLVRYNKSNNTKEEFFYPQITNSIPMSSTIATTNDNNSKVYCYVKYKFFGSSNVDYWKLFIFDKLTNTFNEIYNYDVNDDRDRGIGRMPLAVSNTNANLFYFGDYRIYRTINAKNTSPIVEPHKKAIHDDVHALSFAPDGSGLYMGCDGGVAFLQNPTGAFTKSNWEVRHQGINNSLIWGFDDSEINNNIALIAVQDNWAFKKNTPNNWEHLNAYCDGYNAGIDDSNPKLAFWECNFGITKINLLSGTLNSTSLTFYPDNLANVASTISNHPQTGKLLYTFESGVHERLKDEVVTGDVLSDVWSSNIFPGTANYAPYPRLNKFAISESNTDFVYLVYFATNPANIAQNWSDVLYSSSDGGYTFNNVTSKIKKAVDDYYIANTGVGFWPEVVVSNVAVSSINSNKLWVSITGYDKHVKVYGSDDGGETWFNADPNNCLGRLPINDIVYQDGTDDRLYIGTDAGVYTRDNSSENWYRLGDIPNVRVQELKINRCSGTLKAATWGRGLFETELLPDNNKITNFREINTSQTWNEDKAITANLLVSSGKTLTLENMTLFMPKNAKIIVQHGARLELNNAKITNGCGETWYGIEVNGLASKPQPSISEVLSGQYPIQTTTIGANNNHFQHGVLLMDNGSIIEHAINAVAVTSNDADFNFVKEYTGGIVIAKDSYFKNNKRSVEFMKYDKDFSISTFQNCHFTVDDDFRFDTQHNYDQGLWYQFTMWDVHGVDILGCKFKDERTDIDLSQYAETKTIGGVSAVDADFTLNSILVSPASPVGPSTWKRARFDNLYRAVRATKTDATSMGNIRIDECDIENARYGIYLKNCNNAIVVRNNIFGEGDIYQHELGVTLEAMNGYNFTENKIRKMGTAFAGQNIGGQNGANVYKNEFKNNDGAGISLGDNNSKLQVNCNDFLENRAYDINFAGGSLASQGNANQSAGNSFSINNSYDLIGLTNTTGALAKVSYAPNFSYYHSPLVDKTPQYIAPGITLALVVNPSFQNQCATKPLIVFDPETGTSSSSNVDLYNSVLSGILPDIPIPCSDYPFLCNLSSGEIIEFALDESIKLHTYDPNSYTETEGGVKVNDGIINLLKDHQTSPYRKAQLASFYTQYGKYTKANQKLNEIILDSNIDQEWKDLADIYLMKNSLESQDKTWLDIADNDLNEIQTFAIADNYNMATVTARNILEIVSEMRFDEELIDFDVVASNDSSSTDTIAAAFNLYPNPVNGILHIGYNKPITEPFIVRIYDLINNELIYETEMNAEPFLIEVSAWEDGYYSVVISNQNEEQLFVSQTHIKN